MTASIHLCSRPLLVERRASSTATLRTTPYRVERDVSFARGAHKLVVKSRLLPNSWIELTVQKVG